MVPGRSAQQTTWGIEIRFADTGVSPDYLVQVVDHDGRDQA
ncbi:hypothetical protein [Nocardioides pinisoli]|nr:hypothetical protein [Nocardioides pinisoli]